jgi:hypothetical protein
MNPYQSQSYLLSQKSIDMRLYDLKPKFSENPCSSVVLNPNPLKEKKPNPIHNTKNYHELGRKKE